jgi:hypothetical protein
VDKGRARRPSAYAVDGRFGRAVTFEPGLDRTSTVHEQLDGGRGGQPHHGYEDLAGDTEWLAAGGHYVKTGYLSDQGVGEARSLADDVFAVV